MLFHSCANFNAYVAYKRPFHPPSPAHTPVLVRATTFAGEAGHPLTPKRTVVVPVALLPLKKMSASVENTALHNIKVLAGSRWTMDPPKDAGLPSWRHQPVYASEAAQEAEELGRHGYIKVSCELFPETQMNLKWCMDALRRLVLEANVSQNRMESQTILTLLLGTRYIREHRCLIYRRPTAHKTYR